MFRLAQRLSATTACFVFLFVNTPAATLAQDAPPPTEPVQSASPPVTDHTITEGTHVLDAAAVSSLSSLTIDRGATAVIDFGNASHFTLPGDLVNKGNLFVGSSNPAVNAAHLNAANIVNRHGATISSVLPTEGVGGFTSVVANLDLVLNAVQNILNQGTIRSSGNLTMNAGGSIVNEAVMSAAQNVNLMSAIGSITNTGTISALAGNLNVTAATASNIALNNVGGTLQALNGAINVRDAAFDALANLDINGGSFVAQEINLYSGAGDITASLDNVEGSLSTYSHNAQVGASTQNLTLGEVCLTGDPIFYNDAGGITLTGDVIVAEDLAILARDDITALSGVTRIGRASGIGVEGHDIYIVAGADLTGSGPTTSTLPSGSSTAGSVTVNGPSDNGGNIDFSAASITIDASTSFSGPAGASVTLIAFAGDSNPSSGGHIRLGTSQVLATNAEGGGINVIAGAAPGGTAIEMGGASSPFGSLSIYAAQPAFSGGFTNLTFSHHPLIPGELVTDTTFAPGAGGGGDIALNGTILMGGNVLVQTSGGAVTTGANVTAGNSLNVTAGGTITVNNHLRGGTSLTMLTTSGDIVQGTAGLLDSNDSSDLIDLQADDGNIGSASTPLKTAADTLAARALGTGHNVFIDEGDDVNLGNALLVNSATGTFDLLASASIRIHNSVTGDNLVVLHTVEDQPGNGGDISQGSAAGKVISSGLVNLQAENGSIGTSAQRVQTQTANLVAQASSGTNVSSPDVFISEFDNVNMSGNSSANGTFNLLAGNDITATGGDFISADSVVLSSTAGSIGTSTGQRVLVSANNLTANAGQNVFIRANTVSTAGVELSGNSSASGTFDLSNLTDHLTNNTNPSDTITAGTVVLLSSDGGIGSTTGRVRTAANTLVATAKHNVFITESDSVNLSGAAFGAVGSTFDVQAGDSITANGNITGSSAVVLTAGNNITSTASAVVSSPSVTLTAISGSIGSAVSRVRVEGSGSPQNVNITANAGQNVFIDQQSNQTINIAGPSSAGATFDVLSGTAGAGRITVNGSITAPIVVLTTVAPPVSGSNGITVNSNIGATSSITLNSAQGLDVNAPLSVAFNGLIDLRGSSVAITAPVSAPGTGAGGTVVINPLATGTGTFTLDASHLQNITANRLMIGMNTFGGAHTNYDIVMTGSGNVVNVNRTSVGTTRSYTGTGSTLTFSPSAASVGFVAFGNGAASFVKTGNITGPQALTYNVEGTIFIDGDVGGAGVVRLTSHNAGIVRTAGAPINAPNLFLLAPGDIGGSGQEILVGSINVYVNGGSDAFIKSPGTVSLINGFEPHTFTSPSIVHGIFHIDAPTVNIGSGSQVYSDTRIEIVNAANLTVTHNGFTSSPDTRFAGDLGLTMSGFGTVNVRTSLSDTADFSSAFGTVNVSIRYVSPKVSGAAGTDFALSTFSTGDDLRVTNVSASNGSASLTAGGNLKVLTGGSVSATVSASLVSTQGGIQLEPGSVVMAPTSINVQARFNIGGTLAGIGELHSPGGTITLSSSFGSIGTATQAIPTFDIVSLAASAPNGNVYVNNQSSSVRVTAGSALGTWSLVSTGEIFGPLSSALPIQAPSGTIILTSTGSRIGSTFDRVRVDAGNLVVNAPLSFAFIIESNSVTISQPSSFGDLFSLTAGADVVNGGDITVNAPVTALSSIAIGNPGSGGDIVVNADITSTTGSVFVLADGDLTTSPTAFLRGGLFVAVQSNTGNIGTGTSGRVNIDTPRVQAKALANTSPIVGNVFLAAAGSVDIIGNSSAVRTFDLTAAGTITNNSATGAVSATDVVLTATSSGLITIGQNISGSNSISLTADGKIQGFGPGGLVSPTGTVTLLSNNSDVDLWFPSFVDAAVLSASAPSPAGRVTVLELNTVSVIASSAGDSFEVQANNGDISVDGPVSAQLVSLGVANGSIALNDDITGTAFVFLSAVNGISAAPGATIFSSGKAEINTLNGDVGSATAPLHTDVARLAGGSGTGSAYFEEANDVTLLGGGADFTYRLVAAGNIDDFTTSTHLGEAASFTIQSTGGNVTLSHGIIQSSIDLNVLAHGNVITMGAPGQRLESTGTVNLVSDTGFVQVGGFRVAGSSVNVTASRLIVDTTILTFGSPGTVTVQNPVGGNTLTVEGAGTITAAGGIHLTASGTSPLLTVGTTGQTLTFNGDAFLTACLGTVTITSGATVSASSNITVQACTFLNPSGIQLQNPTTSTLTFNICPGCSLGVGNGGKKGGTIANMNGDVVLVPNMVVGVDGDLAIIASGNVRAQGNLNWIHTHAGSGDAGDLTIIAGFDFTPGTTGQVKDKTTQFVLVGPSVTGGSVQLAGTNIKASGDGEGANGGNVLIVARAGTLNAGNVAIGNINTSSEAAAGGNVTILAHGSVQTGSINTLGATANGFLAVSAGAEPVPTGTITIHDGTIVSGGSFVPAMSAPFTLFYLPTSVVAPITLPPPPSASSSGGGGGGPSAHNDRDDESELVPVSFVQSAAPLAAIKNGIHTVRHDTATIKHDGSADLKVEQPGVLMLNGGSEVLVIASRDTVVKAGIAHVSVSKGTIAALGMDGDSVTVRNLRESKGNSLTVYVNGKHSLRVAAGEEVVVGASYSATRGALQDQLVGRRKLTHHEVSGGVSAASCEFSLPTLMRNSYVLQKLARSEDKADRDITNTLTKMAACLHLVTAGHGAYSHRVP